MAPCRMADVVLPISKSESRMTLGAMTTFYAAVALKLGQHDVCLRFESSAASRTKAGRPQFLGL